MIAEGAKNQCRRKRDKDQSSATDHDHRNLQIAGATNDGHQQVEQPNQRGARKNGGRIRAGNRESISGDAHIGVEVWAQHVHGGRRRETKRNSQRYGVPRVFTRGADPAGPKGARDGRDDAAADRALSDGEHQRDQRKYRRNTGKRVYPQPRHEIDLKQSNQNLDGHDRGIGYRKSQDGGRDRLLQQHPGAGVDFSGSSARLPVRVLAALFGTRKFAGLT